MTMNLPNNREITYFAETSYRDHKKVFGIKRRDRRQHMYVLGKSGSGKSVLLSNMLYQDIKNGHGCCIIDPHGDTVEEIIGSIPEDRLDDVVYFNPADTDFHMGFNILEVKNDAQKHLVASGIMGVFTKIWANAWSARMEYILNNCILALLDTPGTTLLGIQRILVDNAYRKKIVANIKDPVVRTFWVHEFESWQDRYRTEAIAPIQNKVGQFLSTSIIRNILGQQKSTVDFSEIMNQEKIFLVNLSKGRIGEGNGALLGGMIITKLQLAAMERVQIPEEERKDFYLYVDEFQNFVTESFASILSEARKYRLNLTVAHQYIAQLETDQSTVVRDAVFGNVGTMIIFRVGAADADFLETEFMPEFTPEDFVSLPNWNIYLKLMVDGMTTRPFSAKTIPPLAKFERNPEKENRIIEQSRRLYNRSKADVENEISDWSNNEEADSSKSPRQDSGNPRNVGPSIKDTKPEDGNPKQGHAGLPSHIDTSDLAALGIEFSGSAAQTPPKASSRERKPLARSDFTKKSAKTGLKYAKPKPQTNRATARPIVQTEKLPEKNRAIANNEPKINLKDLLGEALGEVGTIRKPAPIKNPDSMKDDKESKPTMSLSALQSKKETVSSPILDSKKQASSESSSALKDALAKAMGQSSGLVTPKDSPAVSPPLQKESQPSAASPEIPEDVLKKLLS